MVSTGRAVLLAGILAACAPRGVGAQALSARELHDRIVAVFAARATRPLPVGDTLVSWYGHPILLHTVSRNAGAMREGMLRVDSLLGTAEVEWQAGRVTRAVATWTHGDSTETDVELVVQRDSIRVTGTTSSSRTVPANPWGVADYGMEDLLVPTLLALPDSPEATQVEVYRPYAAKWENLQVSRRPVGDAVLYELRDADGKRDWWLVSRAGALVQLRREGQEFERRPLEETQLTAEYLRLKQLLPQ
jgi:hypothetical protein